MEKDYEQIHKEVLYRLREAGYTRLSFSCYDRKIPISCLRGVYYKDPMHYMKGCLYVYPDYIRDNKGSPAIWDIVYRMDIGQTGGSSGYYGLRDDYAEYVGSYSYRLVRGVWKRVPRLYDDIELLDKINKACINAYSYYNVGRNKLLDILSDDDDVIAKASDGKVLDVLTCSMEELPLYINDPIRGPIAIHRLRKGR